VGANVELSPACARRSRRQPQTLANEVARAIAEPVRWLEIATDGQAVELINASL